MPFEKRPDGSLRLAMHVPLWQTLVVFVACLGMGGYFGWAGTQPSDGTGQWHGIEYSLPPYLWRIGFFVAAAVLLGTGIFLLLGLLRGGKPHVRIEPRRLVVSGMAMAADRAMRWDEVEKVSRFSIMHGKAITVKSRSGRKIQLSEHTFASAHDFDLLCAQIEYRVACAREETSTPG